ncbi:MAG: thrombospondin type 3 repeat-containing protein [Patescibacteria group bacterium]
MPDIIRQNPPDSSPDKGDRPDKINERKIFALVGLIGVVALFLGFMQLLQQIRSPFLPEDVTLSNAALLTNEQLSEINNLRSADTDGDGLFDYDELYVHNTSPYLKDSDSDGISDKEEVTNGTDPNCPSGQDCTGSSNTNSVKTNSSSAGQNNTNSGLLAGNMSADTLRVTLKNAGVPQSVLDGTSDEDLLAVYNQTISETKNANTNSSVSANNNLNINLNTNTAADTNISVSDLNSALQDLTPAEIRELLTEYGLEESMLNNVDDDTLQAIFLQAMAEQEQTETNTNINQ